MKLKRYTCFLLLLLFGASTVMAQNTVGTLSYDPSESYLGYNLYFPHNQSTVWLIDNCGQVVHTWEDEADWRPGNTVYITKEGNLIKSKRDVVVTDDVIWSGGGGEVVEIRDWDNNLIWSFTMNNADFRLHHDAIPMPGGNVLVLAWERISADEAIALGRDPATLPDGELWAEKLMELEPVGTSDFNIVWEWRVLDHIVQFYDEYAPDYGLPSQSIGRIDINYDTSDGSKDWLHANAIDYNPFLDQVLISIPTFNEIWIIDHSTTTAQAASSSGGFSGVGGNLIYRYGNPAAYGRGDASDQKFFYQHDAHWLDIGLDSGSPDFAKIGVFNNRVSDSHSTANIIAPIFVDYESNYPLIGEVYGPSDFDWEYTAPNPSDMYSNILSSVQRLPNGNTLISVGRPGYSFELNPANDIVWEYKNPMQGGSAVEQGTELDLNANLQFNMKRYPADYAGFVGRDLTPIGYIELNADEEACLEYFNNVGVAENEPLQKAVISPNPFDNQLRITLADERNKLVEVYDLMGQLVYQTTSNALHIDLDTQNWLAGVYIVKVNKHVAEKIVLQR